MFLYSLRLSTLGIPRDKGNMAVSSYIGVERGKSAEVHSFSASLLPQLECKIITDENTKRDEGERFGL